MKYSQKDIRRFFEGKLSKADAKSMMEWMNSPEGEAQMGSMIEETWEEENRGQEKKNPKSRQTKNIRAFVAIDPISPTIHPKKKQQFKIWFGIAATIVLLVTVGFAIYSFNPGPNEEIVAGLDQPTTIHKSTERGQRKKVVLPDGSQVTLNAESRIEFGGDFKSNRKIRLEGEAFFEVVKDPSHPFSVISHNLTTTALGTSFNIKAYGEDKPIQVSLATGKVIVEDNLASNEAIMVSPGEGVHFDPGKNALRKSKVDLKGALSWQQGILHFEKVPFNEILTELERWYGIEFEVKGKTNLPTLRCSGTFGPNEYLSNVLQALGHSVEFDYQIKDKTVLLDLNNAKPMKQPNKPS